MLFEINELFKSDGGKRNMRLALIKIDDGEISQLLMNADGITKILVDDGYTGNYIECDYAVYRDLSRRNIVVVETARYGEKEYVNETELVNYILMTEMGMSRADVYNALRSAEDTVIYIQALDGKGSEVKTVIDDKIITRYGIDICGMQDIEILFRLFQSEKFNV